LATLKQDACIESLSDCNSSKLKSSYVLSHSRSVHKYIYILQGTVEDAMNRSILHGITASITLNVMDSTKSSHVLPLIPHVEKKRITYSQIHSASGSNMFDTRVSVNGALRSDIDKKRRIDCIQLNRFGWQTKCVQCASSH
jgi:hypothetical protein